MSNAILRRKPHVGNPYVLLGGHEVFTATLRHGFLLRAAKTTLSMVAVASSLSAGAVSITTNTTVGESDVANYMDADIDIATGVTLTFSELKTSRTFTGKLTGGGNFVVKSAAWNNTVRITFAGDASAFTGETCVTNHFFTSNGPGSISPVRLRYRMTDAGRSYLNGPGTYVCAVDARPCDNHANGLVVPSGVTLAGDVFWRGGRLCGPGTVTGKVTLDGNNIVYGQDGIHFAGGVATTSNWSGSLQADSSSYYIDSAVTKLAQVTTVGECVYFGTDEAFNDAQVITFGASHKKFGGWDLQGHSQHCGTINTANTEPANIGNTYFRSEAPATLVCKQIVADQVFYGNLLGAFTLDYSSSEGGVFTLAGTDNTTTGKLIVRSGTLALAANSVFSALSAIEVVGGKLELKAQMNAAGVVQSAANVAYKTVTLRLSGGGKVQIPAGVELSVNAANVGEMQLPAGVYTHDSETVGQHLVGDGTLVVVTDGSPAVEEGATFSWTGAGADSLLTTAENWKDGVAPTFDGTERLVFGKDATSYTATVAGTKSVYAIDIKTGETFTLNEADDSARILMGAGGFAFTNAISNVTVAHALAVSVELGSLPQTWSISDNAVLEAKKPWIGRFLGDVGKLTLNARGRVKFQADNSALETVLLLTGCPEDASQPYVEHEKGLGSPNRTTWIVGDGTGCLPRFRTSLRAMTNNVPLRICNRTQNQEKGYFNDISANGLYLDALVTFFSAESKYAETFVRANAHFRGGITMEAAAPYTLRMPGNEVYVEGPIQCAGIFALDYGGTMHLKSVGNSWSEFNNYKATVKFYVEHALPADKTVKLCGSGQYEKADTTLDLNGYDQETARLLSGLNAVEKGAYVATITSATPATLTIAGTDTNNDWGPFLFTGAASLVYDKDGSIQFTNQISTTTGALDVRKGTVKFLKGAGWTGGGTNVVLRGGTIMIGPNAGTTAFGKAQGVSKAWMRYESGTLDIDEGEQATVRTVLYTKDDREESLVPGVYWASDTAQNVSENYKLDWLTGKGSLRVLKSALSGIIIVVR